MEKLKHYELNRGEMLWVQRMRQGRNQMEEARRRGIGRTTYSRLENDRTSDDRGMWLTRSEALVLARRRSTLELPELALILGVSRPTIHKWERLGSGVLVKFWNRNRRSLALQGLPGVPKVH